MIYPQLTQLQDAEAQANLPQLIQQAVSEGAKFKVSSEHGSVVVLSEESFEHLLITLELLSTPGLLENLSSSDGDGHEEIQHA